MPITFVLLALAIVAIWLPPFDLGPCKRMILWPALFLAAVLSGWVEGYLTWEAIVALAGMLLLAAFVAWHGRPRLIRMVAGIALGSVALALGLHRWPGFQNPILIDHVRLSPDAVPFTQFANFDKGAVGLILLGVMCHPTRQPSAWRASWLHVWRIAAVAVIGTLVLALAVGLVRPDVKLHPYTPIFLMVNLLFTCVAEEAFFRGVWQEWLTRALASWRAGKPIVIAASALSFGAAHAAGGMRVASIATALGLGCAIAYAQTRKVEAAILPHFAFNAVHFIGFTYPQLA